MAEACTKHYMKTLADVHGFPERDVVAAFTDEHPTLAWNVCEAIADQLEDVASPRRRGERLCAWAKQNRRGFWHASTHLDPDAPKGRTFTHEEIMSKERGAWSRFTHEQIARNLKRLDESGIKRGI